jgi:hypothetical protein
MARFGRGLQTNVAVQQVTAQQKLSVVLYAPWWRCAHLSAVTWSRNLSIDIVEHTALETVD